MGKFSKDQIEIMRKAYGTLSRMDPSSPTYKKFIKFLGKLPKNQLKQLAAANIKFVSMLAKNRIKGESVNEENESPWTWIYKGLLGGWKKAEKKGGNRVEEVAYAVAFLIKTEYGSGAKKDFSKEFNRKLK